MNAEKVHSPEGKFLGIVHESCGNWFVTLPQSRKNLYAPDFSTCSNGLVRLPKVKNYYSAAIVFASKDEAKEFITGHS